ncbi:MAG: DUF512 domain-containing protein [Eubacterium sp.]|nr:DUF512 domain-containing protein [Eubacterium sp.]
MKKHKIDFIEPGSIAEELGIETGDYLLTVNKEEIEDVFDYHFLINEEYVEVLVEKKNGEEWELEIEKEYEEDLGIGFQNGLMDAYRSCHNKCIFCFIDQMPPGMRDTLYFKDDDSRLSFLQGNYVTLTNLKETDVERIITYKLAPINISVQTMNPRLRCKMLNNRFAGEALALIKRFYDAGITMNGQIVLCKGINDGEELEYSIAELAKYAPVMESVSVVPVGLSKYRDGLYPLEPFTKEEAKQVLDTVHKWQQKIYADCGLHFIHASDEWYLLAERPLPEESRYDGYLQLENGVGMLRLLKEEFTESLAEAVRRLPGWESQGKSAAGSSREPQGESAAGSCQDFRLEPERLTIVTGVLAAPMLTELCAEFMRRFPQKEVVVQPITNHFFGDHITVSGLLTGQDIVSQMQGKDAGSRILLPCNMFKSGETVFLDDMTAEEMEKTLQVKTVIVKSNGCDLVNALLGGEQE